MVDPPPITWHRRFGFAGKRLHQLAHIEWPSQGFPQCVHKQILCSSFDSYPKASEENLDLLFFVNYLTLGGSNCRSFISTLASIVFQRKVFIVVPVRVLRSTNE